MSSTPDITFLFPRFPDSEIGISDSDSDIIFKFVSISCGLSLANERATFTYGTVNSRYTQLRKSSAATAASQSVLTLMMMANNGNMGTEVNSTL